MIGENLFQKFCHRWAMVHICACVSHTDTHTHTRNKVYNVFMETYNVKWEM